MKREDIKVLVLTGDGVNCEVETASAFLELGAKTDIIHIADLIDDRALLNKYDILVLPGGFSFGDEIGSGQILALKLKYKLGEELKSFISNKKIILGICNGFQALVKLGLLANIENEKMMTLTHNRQAHFLNKWVNVKVHKSHCIWTKLLEDETLYLPIRHGEGRIVFSGNDQKQKETYEKLKNDSYFPLTYLEDVNGSYGNIAGATDTSGRIFGLMPHPEAAVSFWQSPCGNEKSDESGLALLIFESGLKYIEENF